MSNADFPGAALDDENASAAAAAIASDPVKYIPDSASSEVRAALLNEKVLAARRAGDLRLVDWNGDTKTRPRLLFHAGQYEAWKSIRRFVLMLAGTGGGKTAFGPWWLEREIGIRGGGDYIAVTSTHTLAEVRMIPELLNVFEHILGIGRLWPSIGVIEIKDPVSGKFLANKMHDAMYARILLRSAQNPNSLEAATAKAAWADEAGQSGFGLDAWQALNRRLGFYEGRCLLTTTPYVLGWLKQLLYDEWARGDKDIDVIQFASIRNPAYSRDEFRRMRRIMAAWKFRQFYLGLFDRPPGQIYHDFIDKYRTEGGHKVPAFQPPNEWPRYGGADPGGTNSAKVWLAFNPAENVYYLYRESLDSDKSIKEEATAVLELAKKHGERIIQFVVGQKSEKQVRKDWVAAGVYQAVEPPFKEVEIGIDRVIQLLREFRLYICDNCVGVLDQLATYSRVVDESDQPTTEIRDKEKYHFLDALRYAASVITEKHGVGFG